MNSDAMNFPKRLAIIVLAAGSVVGSASRLHPQVGSRQGLVAAGAPARDDSGPSEADRYVATDGDDQAAGTKAAPFRTIAKAQAALRARPVKEQPISVWIRGGTYYLSGPLLFTPDDSGSAEAPVTYAAYPGERVTISGGVKLAPKWSSYTENKNIQ